jgi:hypothetical protein
VNTSISVTEAQSVLNSLTNKDIFLSCGYGGVMFVEIGNLIDYHFEHIKGSPTTRKYGEYQLFCDENWTFSDSSGKRIDRWTSSSFETDSLFDSIGVQKLEQIEIINGFERTIFHISSGFTFTIHRDDAIDTFSLSLIPEKKRLRVFGNGNIKFEEYEDDRSYLKEIKPRPKRTETISVSKEFIQPTINQKIASIEVRSGTCFSINLGDDCRRLLSKEDQAIWINPLHRWSLSIDEVWVLKHGEDIVLDVRKERFHFKEKLISHLKDKLIIKITFDENGAGTKIIFSDGYTLVVLETSRYSRWDMHDVITGFTVGSYRGQGLVYRVSPPIPVRNKYNTDDVHLNSILFELQFYRDFFAGNL